MAVAKPLTEQEIADFTNRMICINGSRTKNYFQVKDRLVLLRRLHPDATVETFLLSDDVANSRAVFRAVITLPNGTIGTGHGSETKGDFKDYLEKAESKALGRALNAAGIGLQFDNGADFAYEEVNPDAYVGVDGTIEAPSENPSGQQTKPRVTSKVKAAPIAVPDTIAELTREQLIKVVSEEQVRMGKNAATRMLEFCAQRNIKATKKDEMSDDELRQIYVWAQTQEAA